MTALAAEGVLTGNQHDPVRGGSAFPQRNSRASVSTEGTTFSRADTRVTNDGFEAGVRFARLYRRYCAQLSVPSRRMVRGDRHSASLQGLPGSVSTSHEGKCRVASTRTPREAPADHQVRAPGRAAPAANDLYVLNSLTSCSSQYSAIRIVGDPLSIEYKRILRELPIVAFPFVFHV